MTQYEYYTTILRYTLEGISAIGLTMFVVGLAVTVVTLFPFWKK